MTDSLPTVAAVWASACALGVMGLLIWRRSRRLGVLGTLLAGAMLGTFVAELRDPRAAPAIRAEANYLAHTYAALGVAALLHLAGIAAWYRKRRG